MYRNRTSNRMRAEHIVKICCAKEEEYEYGTIIPNLPQFLGWKEAF